MVERIKVGLALGGGAARGLAHIGVLEVLEREGVPIDMIAGTSMGAVVGAFYAYTRDLTLMKSMAVEFGERRLRFFTDLTIPRTGILRWHWVESRLKEVIGGVRFDDLKIPFRCVAVDIDTGEQVVMQEGPVWDAVRASATVPVALTILPWQGRYLVDGGIVNPVPVSLLKDMGADIVIAVNVLHDGPAALNGPSRRAGRPNIFSVMVKTVYVSSYHLIGTSMRGADVVVEPEMRGIGYTDFHRAEECFRRGARAVEEHGLQRIREVLLAAGL